MRRSNARTRVGSKPNQMDPMMKLQMRSNNLFARNSKATATNNAARCCQFSNTFLAPLFFSLLLFLSYYAFFSSSSSSGNGFRYRIIVDGGSTGTRIHVFKYGVDDKVFDFGKEGLASMRVNPGLSSFAEDPDGAGMSLSELVEFGKGRIPRGSWRDTEIRLMATAGLRMLDAEVQEKILESCRRVLRSSGFKFRDEWASVITGSDEGVYAWVVANYALGTLGGDPLDTTGIIELGGASAQVTFISRESVLPLFSRAVKFGNTTYNLYSHSFLHFGQNAAHDSWKEALISGDLNLASQSLQEGLRIDPCTPTGYSHNVESLKFSLSSLNEKSQYQFTVQTKGNFSECRSAALMLLQNGKESCSNQHCDIGSTFIPKLQGKFLATENFFYTSKFFRLEPRAYLSNLMTAGQEFCGEDWLRLKKKYPSHEEEDLLRYCFSSAYIVALLHDSLGIALDDERVKVANQVGSIPLDWALGAFILQTTSDADIQMHDWIAAFFSGGNLS
ncbi:probable apyrase 6 isoform X2 [Gastrolobium bilobum]|uniref:probable apyrase 6 isoform X2 n=1 Tax=Gastrolobium bilobum TaxID=150636 RepID=UPI002AAF691A|nr:probable apyrase 6 isoform X2 [Gastrolobium bilobum]